MAPEIYRNFRGVIGWKGVNDLDAWKARPIEVANNLNPAFCTVLINSTIAEYQNIIPAGLDYSLGFLILPIILHRVTRERLPRGISTKLHSWMQKNQDIKIGFAERVNQTIPFTKETLLFGLQQGVFTISETGKLVSLKGLSFDRLAGTSELRSYYLRSRFLGRWFADASDRRIIYTIWGIKP